jgi:DNA topoisomerase I
MSFIHRKRTKNGFIYDTITEKDKDRIKSLRIPPQWENVLISTNSSEKIQATGLDSKGRKQYIYHPKWIMLSKKYKFDNMNKFCHKKYSALINKYIALNDMSKGWMICNMLKMMEDLNIRVGNEVYLHENNSVGLTTLMKKHLNTQGDKMLLSFRGKKGVRHDKEIKDPVSMNFIRKILGHPGSFLFTHDKKCVTSNDLNRFLKDKFNGITCKDIRTYSANCIFNKYMTKINKINNPQTEREKKKNISLGVKHTAEQLGNTPKVCRDSYISPDNITKYL